MRRIRWLLLILLLAMPVGYALAEEYLPLAVVSSSPIPVPPTFDPPPGVTCIGGSQPSTLRHLGTLYATCNTRRTPTGEPGAAVFVLRPTGWQLLLVVGVSSSDAQLWVDSLDNRLYVSYTATASGTQYNRAVPVAAGEVP